MAENLFQGLPPPSSSSTTQSSVSDESQPSTSSSIKRASSLPPMAPAPALKSALKRSKPPNPPPPPVVTQPHQQPQPQPQEEPQAAPQKRLRFKTSVDATEAQVIEAMQKIASHIKNPAKFNKASKLALQLIQAGSVKPGISDHFFAVLESAMSSPSSCMEPSLRAGYHALFSEVQDIKEWFSKLQNNQLTTWTIKAVVANDLYTDDSFVFSKAAGKIKEAISNLPPATADDDKDEAAALATIENEAVNTSSQDVLPSATSPRSNQEVSDPFGLDVLLSSASKKEEKLREKEIALLNRKAEEEDWKRFNKSQREALLLCLEIAARRYKIPWAQTVIDILVKHAFDSINRFTSQQRDAINKLWASIKEQQIRRKQGKSVAGKLDMNAFEWLQEKYASEKISIRHAVGGGGERRAAQWLG